MVPLKREIITAWLKGKKPISSDFLDFDDEEAVMSRR